MLPMRPALFVLSCFLFGHPAQAAQPTTETIVMIRHGEKPGGGLGQLSCQGFNRALALAGVLERRFGRPDAVFVPDPAIQKRDHGTLYDYVRPLATVEPAAIAWSLPIRAGIGFSDASRLQAALGDPALAGAVVLVAWEHTQIVLLSRQLLAAFGGTGPVPAWNDRDYDGIYVVRITRQAGVAHSDFSRSSEGLNGMPAACPAPAPR